jgi:hypothetical protein
MTWYFAVGGSGFEPVTPSVSDTGAHGADPRQRSSSPIFVSADIHFPGHKIITAILDAGGHVVARAKSDLALPAAPGGGGWLPDGSG